MKAYQIADLKVNMQVSGRAAAQGEKYKVSDLPFEDADITILVPPKQIERYQEKHPGMTADAAEYYLSGYEFYKHLLDHNGCFLHASAVCLDEKAYLFSAECGVGKSTHTSMWLKAFPNAFILNDDKPAIRMIDDRFFAFGTPWSGKTDQNVARKVPLQAICFIERGDHNRICPISAAEAIGKFIPQTYNFHFVGNCFQQLLSLLDCYFSRHTAYRLECLPNVDAAILSHNVLKEIRV